MTGAVVTLAAICRVLGKVWLGLGGTGAVDLKHPTTWRRCEVRLLLRAESCPFAVAPRSDCGSALTISRPRVTSVLSGRLRRAKKTPRTKD